MMKLKLNLILILLIISVCIYSQKKSNANTVATNYDELFLYGSNMDYKNGNWSDAEVADLLTGNPDKNIVGVGANSLRPALYEYYLEKNGYDNRVPSFQHYRNMGAINNVVFIGDRPDAAHQEDNYYCRDENGNIIKEERIIITDENGIPLEDVNGKDSVRIISYRSKSYKNLYEPIWVLKDTIINNQKTQIEVINQDNYYAYYVYKLVYIYKDYVKFYEIKNEPDYTSTGEGNLKKGELSLKKVKSWWDQDPNPKSLKNFYAPVQSYVRLLRISYEVIKSIDPDALICVGGIGYVGFLDAILRNTDNPDGGKVTEQYPYTGGAWFDCLSYHNYPMYYLDKWVGRDYPDNIEGKLYYRHSDAAVDELIIHQKEFESLLESYGYNGVTYPSKITILTETNVPNKPIANFIGGEDQQRNYLLKASVIGQKNGLKGMFPYCPWDFKFSEDSTGREYDYKGFYYPVPESPILNDSIIMHDSADGWRTISSLIGDKKYDKALSENLSNDSIRGAAFKNQRISAYALWAITTKDMDETASATFRFSDDAFIDKNNKVITEVKWDPENREYVSNIIKGNTVKLTGDVAFYCTTIRQMPVTHVKLDETVLLMNSGDTMQLSNTIYPSYAYDQRVRWSTSDNSIATVNDNGTVIAYKEGLAYVTVTSLDGAKSAMCEVVVGKPDGIYVQGISLNKNEISLFVEDTTQLKAKVYPDYASNKEVEWYSSNTSIVKVDQDGIVKAVSSGIAWINAKALYGAEGKIGPATCRVVVSRGDINVESVSLNVSTAELNIGNSLRLSAIIHPSNASNKSVVWYSSDESIATVEYGVVTALKKGVVWINVKTVDGDKIATAEINVLGNTIHVNKVTLDKKTMTLSVGDTSKLIATVTPANATNKDVTWYSSNENIATVANGIVTGVKEGTVWINVRTKDGNKLAVCQATIKADKTSVEGIDLDKKVAEVNIGGTLKLTATISPSDATNKDIIWYSNDEKIATVANGIVTGVKEGIVWITARTVDGNKTIACEVTVRTNKISVSKVEIDKKTSEIYIGDILQLTAIITPSNATNKDITWYSSDESLATVDKGLVTGLKEGIAWINAKTVDGNKRVVAKVTILSKNRSSLVDDINNDVTLSYLSNQLTIESENEIIKRVEIYDAMGGLIHADSYNSNRVEILHLSNLSSRTLIIRIITDKNNVVIKKLKI